MGKKNRTTEPAWTSPVSGASMPITERPLTALELSERLGVSDRSIRVWASMGLPVADQGARGGGNRFFEFAVREWLGKHSVTFAETQAGVSLGGHGGVRPGAGRPPGPAGAAARASAPAAAAPGGMAEFVEARKRSAIARAVKDEIEVARLQNEVVSRQEVEEAFNGVMFALVRELERIPRQAANAILALHNLHPDQYHSTEQVIESCINEARDRFVEAGRDQIPGMPQRPENGDDAAAA